MIVYTNETATAAGAGIAAQIQQAVDRANLAYANSGVVPRLRLVHSAQVSYSEAGLTFNDHLDRLTSTSDSHMDEVHAWRNTYGADVVSLFIENGAYCGLGWLSSSATSAFTVVNRGCAGGNLSFAHEVGHNFGAHHDPVVDHQHVLRVRSWLRLYRGEVAHGDGVQQRVRRRRRELHAVPYFSNPDVSYGSPATATGTVATHDNARVHDERANTVANFRQAVTVAAPSVTTVAATASPRRAPRSTARSAATARARPSRSSTGSPRATASSVAAAQSPLAAGAATGAACRPRSADSRATRCITSAWSARAPAAPPTAPTSRSRRRPAPRRGTDRDDGRRDRVTTTGATLNGIVSSNGASTTVTFQYGLTTSYGSTATAAQSPLAAGAAGAAVSAAIGGLACNTLHHFRVVAANAGGTTNGADLTFTTAPCSGTIATTTTLASNANPSAAGTAVTLTAAVTGAAPTGIVAFREGGSADRRLRRGAA